MLDSCLLGAVHARLLYSPGRIHPANCLACCAALHTAVWITTALSLQPSIAGRVRLDANLRAEVGRHLGTIPQFWPTPWNLFPDQFSQVRLQNHGLLQPWGLKLPDRGFSFPPRRPPLPRTSSYRSLKKSRRRRRHRSLRNWPKETATIITKLTAVGSVQTTSKEEWMPRRYYYIISYDSCFVLVHWGTCLALCMNSNNSGGESIWS